MEQDYFSSRVVPLSSLPSPSAPFHPPASSRYLETELSEIKIPRCMAKHQVRVVELSERDKGKVMRMCQSSQILGLKDRDNAQRESIGTSYDDISEEIGSIGRIFGGSLRGPSLAGSVSTSRLSTFRGCSIKNEPVGKTRFAEPQSNSASILIDGCNFSFGQRKFRKQK